MGGTPITTELVLFLVAVLGAIAGVWWRVEARIEAAKALAAHAVAELADYKTHVAETYITKEGLREQTGQVMAGIGELKASITSVHGRIDSIMINQKHSDAPPRPRAARAG
jgi:uncharacterized protein YpmB